MLLIPNAFSGRVRARERLPFVKRLHFGVVLQATLVNQKLHALEERRRDGGRLLAQQHIDRLRRRHAQLAQPAGGVQTALRILAVHQTVCGRVNALMHARPA